MRYSAEFFSIPIKKNGRRVNRKSNQLKGGKRYSLPVLTLSHLNNGFVQLPNGPLPAVCPVQGSKGFWARPRDPGRIQRRVPFAGVSFKSVPRISPAEPYSNVSCQLRIIPGIWRCHGQETRSNVLPPSSLPLPPSLSLSPFLPTFPYAASFLSRRKWFREQGEILSDLHPSGLCHLDSFRPFLTRREQSVSFLPFLFLFLFFFLFFFFFLLAKSCRRVSKLPSRSIGGANV